jgi:Trypsin-like peptidase domain
MLRRRIRQRVLVAAFAAVAVFGATAVLISADDSIEERALTSASHPVPSVHVVASGTENATSFSVGRDRVVTVAHALKPGEDITVDGRRARVVRADRRSDLALLAAPALARERAPALVADSPREGSRLRLLRLRDGRTTSLSVDVRRAIVAHVRTAGGGPALTRPALELGARVSAGDSGAPLITSSGALAGVIFAVSRNRESTAYAVDAAAVRRLIERR